MTWSAATEHRHRRLPTTRWPTAPAVARAIGRRMPFTLGLLLAIVVAGAAGGTMFHPITEDPSLLRLVGYGVPALREGRLWTLLTSPFFTWQPWMLPTITLSLLLFVAPLELVVGTRRAVVAFFGTHLAGYVLASTFVSWPLDAVGRPWGRELAAVRDVGASAGAFGCAAALTWFLPWRAIRPAQTALAAYLGFWLLATHQLWDVEHAIAAATGYTIARAWAFGDATTLEALRLRSHEWSQQRVRQLVAVVTTVIGVTALVSVLFAVANATMPGGPARVPREVLSGSRPFLALAGILLMLLARGLAQGKRTAWVSAIVVLEGSAIAHVARGPHLRTAAVASVAALVLATQRDVFAVQPDRPALARSARVILLAAVGLVVYAAAGLFALRADFSPAVGSGSAVEDFVARLVFLSAQAYQGNTPAARWFLDSLSLVWVGLLLYTAVVLLRPRLHPDAVSADDLARAEALLRAHGRVTTSAMTLWPGNTLFLGRDHRAYLAYRLVGDIALVVGDPIGPDVALPRLIDDFLAHCGRSGWTPCFYAVTPWTLDLFVRRGFSAVQIAEDAIVRLDGLEFKGKRWQDVRTAINKARRADVRFVWFDQATGDRAVRAQLREISEAWLADKGLPEMGFTLGKLSDPPDPAVRTAIALDAAGRVHGFVTWLPVYGAKGWVIDMMRRRPGAFNGVMEFLIAESALTFQAEGCRMMSLACAPLAHVDRPGEEVTAVQRTLDGLAQRLGALYHFAPLFEFKRKFDPAWSPAYLAYPGMASLPKVALAILRAYLPNAGVVDLTARLGLVTAHALRQRSPGTSRPPAARPARPAPSTRSAGSSRDRVQADAAD